ncbi:MAG: hypothetical protein A2570_01450 [Candidatus Brennerbacteria bacterium RIFOXYD1_FULL_41_16]|uniref:Uncharacterized protein n=1 Tax=Candidatus Brennerbacteria bacterium RIFOXYD1_FULL_41_16 TaxID=1797529 RepID=A0A1G1XLI4_9BACT|nr:MAG: hypothetical protein A2570_01450 [Candidatus Brennerbacteria bacterium RIFOXYD1_FULL_41_16]
MANLSETTNSSEKPRFSFYEGFDGHYHKVGEIRDLIPQFKAFYYAERRKDPSRSAIKVINDFNGQIAPFKFFPWEKQYKLWRKKWDAELLAEQGYKQQQREIRQIIKLQDEQKVAIVPDEYALEVGTHTLAGELLNDAMDILKRDQDSEEAYEEEIIIKRRNYVLNVFNYITRAVHGKEALKLKSNADKRETFGFLTSLINMSTAGKITDEQMELLKQSIPPKKED